MEIPEATLRTKWEALKRGARNDYQRTLETFEEARLDKNYKGLAFKTAGCSLGCMLGLSGVYQIAKGFGEIVPNPEKPNTDQYNWTRICVGAMTTFFGAAALYLSAIAKVGAKAEHLR
jgi:hypothetical protein